MKKLIITCALLTCGTLVSFAQSAQPVQTSTSMQAKAGGPVNAQRPAPPQVSNEQRAERRAKSEEKQLGLSAEQYKSVYAADLEMVKKIEELRTSGKQPDRSEFEAVNKAREEKFSKILTPEQMEKYRAMNNHQHPAPTTAAPGMPTPPMSK